MISILAWNDSPRILKRIVFLILLLLLLAALQWRLWTGQGGILERRAKAYRIVVAEEQIAELKERNQRLEAELDDLKNGLESVEERAREQLGLIKEGEIFYHYFQ